MLATNESRPLLTQRDGQEHKEHLKTQLNYSINEIVEQFKLSMLEYGITPPDTIIGDGVLHRFKIDGKLNGAYVLHLDGRAAGFFQDFKQGVKQKWKLEGRYRRLTSAERKTFREECLKQDAERKAEETVKNSTAAIKAKAIWQSSAPAITHPYLAKKRIQPHQSRIYKGTLVIPLHNVSGELVNLQFIQSDGTKRFLSGGLKKGCFYPIGNIRIADKILIVEGFATGASVHEHTGKPVVIAFDAGNLKAVAETIRAIMPNAEIIIAADNDENGIGEHKAREAAMAIGCKYIIPPVIGDFNDFLTGSAQNDH